MTSLNTEGCFQLMTFVLKTSNLPHGHKRGSGGAVLRTQGSKYAVGLQPLGSFSLKRKGATPALELSLTFRCPQDKIHAPGSGIQGHFPMPTAPAFHTLLRIGHLLAAPGALQFLYTHTHTHAHPCFLCLECPSPLLPWMVPIIP